MLNKQTVKLGTGLTTGDDFRQALKMADMKFGSWTSDLLNQSAFKISGKPIEVVLSALTVAELGFEHGASYVDICMQILQLEHSLCQPEHGPQLRLQYKDQPEGEELYMAMEPIHSSHGDPETFTVSHQSGGGLWLCVSSASPDCFYDAYSWFAFVCRK